MSDFGINKTSTPIIRKHDVISWTSCWILMNFSKCFLLRWERRHWRTPASCWRLIMPSWLPTTSGSSECHTEVPFFYSPVSVHMGAPDCKALWINDLYVRLRNKSPIPTVLRHPQEMNKCVVSEGRMWWIEQVRETPSDPQQSTFGTVKLREGWQRWICTHCWCFSQCVDGMFCGLMWRSDTSVGSDLWYQQQYCILFIQIFAWYFSRVHPFWDLLSGFLRPVLVCMCYTTSRLCSSCFIMNRGKKQAHLHR